MEKIKHKVYVISRSGNILDTLSRSFIWIDGINYVMFKGKKYKAVDRKHRYEYDENVLIDAYCIYPWGNAPSPLWYPWGKPSKSRE